jgi:hypothetical protein
MQVTQAPNGAMSFKLGSNQHEKPLFEFLGLEPPDNNDETCSKVTSQTESIYSIEEEEEEEGYEEYEEISSSSSGSVSIETYEEEELLDTEDEYSYDSKSVTSASTVYSYFTGNEDLSTIREEGESECSSILDPRRKEIVVNDVAPSLPLCHIGQDIVVLLPDDDDDCSYVSDASNWEVPVGNAKTCNKENDVLKTESSLQFEPMHAFNLHEVRMVMSKKQQPPRVLVNAHTFKSPSTTVDVPKHPSVFQRQQHRLAFHLARLSLKKRLRETTLIMTPKKLELLSPSNSPSAPLSLKRLKKEFARRELRKAFETFVKQEFELCYSSARTYSKLASITFPSEQVPPQSHCKFPRRIWALAG